MTTSPTNPATPSRLGVWLQAARPKTLWAAFAPVLIGTAMAFADGALHVPAALAALAGAFLIQIGTNFCNDYADFRKGADTAARTGPLRVTQAGLVTPEAMLRATVRVFALAALISLYLVARGGWPLLVVALLAIASGVLYTAGPYPIGYLGLAELFVLIFFGPVAVAGTYYVQALTVTPAVIVAGLAPGLLAVAILVVNNLRDIKGDAAAGKRTLAVRFGERFARKEYVFCVLAAVGTPVVLFYGQQGEHPFSLLAVLTLPIVRPTMIRVCQSGDPAVLNAALAETARALFLYSVLFSLGWICS